jgi:hypothetical protein
LTFIEHPLNFNVRGKIHLARSGQPEGNLGLEPWLGHINKFDSPHSNSFSLRKGRERNQKIKKKKKKSPLAD